MCDVCAAMVVGVTGPLHWLAGIEEISEEDAAGGRGAEVEVEEASLSKVLRVLWRQQVQARVCVCVCVCECVCVCVCVYTIHSHIFSLSLSLSLSQVEAAGGRAPYEALGRLLFPAELRHQWRALSARGGPAAADVGDVGVAAVGVGVVRSWLGIEGLSGGMELGDEGGVDGLVGAEWWVWSALREVREDTVWGELWADLCHSVRQLPEIAKVHARTHARTRARTHTLTHSHTQMQWGQGWLGIERWARILGVCARLWRVCEGVVIRPASVGARPILRALLAHTSSQDTDSTGRGGGAGGREDPVFVDAQTR